MITYSLRGVIFLLLALMIVLMVCGVLYIRDHLAPAPDSKLPDGNIEDATGDTTVAGNSVITAAPTIPGEVRIVLDAGHGGNQLASLLCSVTTMVRRTTGS